MIKNIKKSVFIIFMILFCENFNIAFANNIEKINAHTSMDFYIDIQNSIIELPNLENQLPQINTNELDFAYQKGFRQLDLLSVADIFTLRPKKIVGATKKEKIPTKYNISFDEQQKQNQKQSVDELYSLALRYKNRQFYKKALDLVDLALEEKQTAPGHFLKADILRAKGDFDLSINEYHKVIELDNNCTDAYFNIAKIYELANNRKMALEYFRHAYTTNPQDYEIKNIILNYERNGISEDL